MAKIDRRAVYDKMDGRCGYCGRFIRYEEMQREVCECELSIARIELAYVQRELEKGSTRWLLDQEWRLVQRIRLLEEELEGAWKEKKS